MLHSPLQDLINFLPLFANPRHFLVIARLDQRDDEDGNDRHDILVPRGHSMYIYVEARIRIVYWQPRPHVEIE